MEKKYKITLTKNQLQLVMRALEEFFRLRMGQDMEFSDEMAQIETDMSVENPNHGMIFDRFIHRRDALREVMRAYYRIAFEVGYLKKKTDDMLMAEDIWDSIRCFLGISRWENSIQVGAEPLPTIKEVEE